MISELMTWQKKPGINYQYYCLMDTQHTLFIHKAFRLLFLRLGYSPSQIDCASALGLESGEIPESAMTASSVYNQYSPAGRGRLNKVRDGGYYGAWFPRTARPGEWIQIDLGKNVKVTKIATQGSYNIATWTKTYSLSYRIQGGSTFAPYLNGLVRAKINDFVLF